MGRDTQKSQWAGAGAVAVGCVPFPTLDSHAHVLQGNLLVLRITHEGFLQQLSDLHKSL